MGPTARLALAIAIESALLVLAAFGGPHGTLGALPWLLQLPGGLVVFNPPGGEFFLPRVGLMFAIQAGLWFALLSWLARRRRPNLPHDS